MSLICIGGVCIPYSLVWPVVLLALRQIYYFIFGGAPAAKPAVHCEGGVCALDSTQFVQSSEKATKSAKSDATETTVAGEGANLTSESQWERLMGQTDRPVIARFSATWCAPCHALQPLFEELSATYADRAEFVTVDIDEFDEVAAANHVVAIPAILHFSKGVVVDRITGKEKDIIRKFVTDACN